MNTTDSPVIQFKDTVCIFLIPGTAGAVNGKKVEQTMVWLQHRTTADAEWWLGSLSYGGYGRSTSW